MSAPQVVTAVAAIGALGLSIFNTVRAEVKVRPKYGLRIDPVAGNRFRLVNYGRQRLVINFAHPDPLTKGRLVGLDGMFAIKADEVREFSVDKDGVEGAYPTAVRFSVEGRLEYLRATIPPVVE